MPIDLNTSHYGDPWNFNQTEAYKSLNNYTTNFPDLLVNLDPGNNTNVSMMSNYSLTNDTQTINAMFYPAWKLWIAQIFGSWYYVALIYIFALIVFVKYDGDLGVTAWVVVLMSAVVLAAVQYGDITIPVEMIRMLYLTVAFGIIGVLYSTFVA